MTSAAIPVGAAIGAVDSFFGQILLKITDIRDANPLYYIPFLPLAGIVIVYCYQKFGGKSSKGMNLVFEVGNGDENAIPLRLIPFVMSGTWLTHLFGGSAGREGVAVQIGANDFSFCRQTDSRKKCGADFSCSRYGSRFCGLVRYTDSGCAFCRGGSHGGRDEVSGAFANLCRIIYGKYRCPFYRS